MIAKIETNVRGCTDLKTSKGILYVYRCEGQDRNKIPYMFDIFSTKNHRKEGAQSIKVSISNRKAKDGRILPGFRMWEVEEKS